MGGAACRYKMADILTVNRGHFILSQSWTRRLFLGSLTNEVHNKLGTIFIFRGFFLSYTSQKLFFGGKLGWETPCCCSKTADWKGFPPASPGVVCMKGLVTTSPFGVI